MNQEFDRISVLESLSIDLASSTPIFQQVSTQLAWLIASGRLGSGERLPSVRSASAHLGINIQTVRSAYRQLETEGLVVTRQGLGTVVLTPAPPKLEFKPGRLASHIIGIILPEVKNPFYHALIEGAEQVAAKEGYLIVLGCMHDDPGLALQYYRQLLAKQADGVILASCLVPGVSTREGGENDDQPVVFADLPGRSGVNILLDLENAGYAAASHLARHGYRRVGMITHELDSENIRPLHAGYIRALEEAKIDPDPALVVRVRGFDQEAGRRGMERLLAFPRPPEAVFCITDLVAIGAIRELKRRGLKVPGDMAVAGFNDIPAASLIDPALTTVAAPAYEMGSESMRRVLALIHGAPLPEKEVKLPVRLVVRESCGIHSTE